MPNRSATLIIVAALFLAALLPAPAMPPDLAADLRANTRRLISGGGDGSCDLDRVLTNLVDIAARIGREGRLAPSLQATLDAALARIKEGPALGDETRHALAAAYAALHEGREFRFPAEVKSVDDARTAAQAEVDRSIRALEEGRPQEAAGALLAMLMMVVTPMEAQV
jgi:predicted trehalose synthase